LGGAQWWCSAAAEKRWMLAGARSQVTEEFKSVAALCAVALGSRNTADAWCDWLEYLRCESDEFKADRFTFQTRLPGRRLYADFEIDVPDHVTCVIGIQPDLDPELISATVGEVDDVCSASERLCQRLADEAQKLELTNLLPASGREPSSPHPVKTTKSSPPDTSRTLTVKEAAKALRVSEDTLHRMRERGEIQMFKVGSQWRVRGSEILCVRESM